jgi:uncharacterized protein YjbI with pentapeptide repeats
VLTDADLRGCDLTGAKLAAVELSSTQRRGARGLAD